jgi:hypothetical protein
MQQYRDQKEYFVEKADLISQVSQTIVVRLFTV